MTFGGTVLLLIVLGVITFIIKSSIRDWEETYKQQKRDYENGRRKERPVDLGDFLFTRGMGCFGLYILIIIAVAIGKSCSK